MVRPDYGLFVANAPLKSGRVPGRERARPADLAEAFCQISEATGVGPFNLSNLDASL